MSPRILTCLSIVALGAGGAVACKPKPAGDARQEAAEKGHEAGRGEGEGVHDRVRLGEEAFQGLKLVFAKVEEKELAPSLEVAAELVPDPDRRAEVCARAPARGRGSGAPRTETSGNVTPRTTTVHAMLKRGRDAARHPGRRGEGGAAGSIVKGGLCLEALGTVDAVVLDKTGTVTFGEPRVAAVHPEEGADEEEVLATAAVGEKRSEHPVARAILAKAAEAGLPVPPPESFLSFPGRATLVGCAYCTVTASPSESIPCRVTCDHAPASPPCVRSRVL